MAKNDGRWEGQSPHTPCMPTVLLFAILGGCKGVNDGKKGQSSSPKRLGVRTKSDQPWSNVVRVTIKHDLTRHPNRTGAISVFHLHHWLALIVFDEEDLRSERSPRSVRSVPREPSPKDG